MDPLTLIILIVVVVGLAYLLGVLMKFRDKRPNRTIDAKPRFSSKPAPSSPASPLAAKVLSTADDRQLKAVTDWLLTQAFEQTGIRVADEPLAYQRIAEAAQKAIHDLETHDTASISLPFLTADASGPKHFATRLTRTVIEELARY